jgi:hypothetical protein
MQPNAPQRLNNKPEDEQRPHSTTLAVLVIILTLVVVVTALIAFRLIFTSN